MLRGCQTQMARLISPAYASAGPERRGALHTASLCCTRPRRLCPTLSVRRTLHWPNDATTCIHVRSRACTRVAAKDAPAALWLPLPTVLEVTKVEGPDGPSISCTLVLTLSRPAPSSPSGRPRDTRTRAGEFPVTCAHRGALHYRSGACTCTGVRTTVVEARHGDAATGTEMPLNNVDQPGRVCRYPAGPSGRRYGASEVPGLG